MADTIDIVEPPPPPPPVTPETFDETVDTTPAIPVEEPPEREPGCFAKKSCLEKVLIIIVIIILILLLAFVVAFLINLFFANPPQGTCLTDDCVKSASRLKNHMDENKDPCNNFYDFACNGWLKNQILGPDEKKIDMESQLRESHMIKLKALLETEIAQDEAEFTKKPKIFYKSCVDTATLDSLNTEPFLNLLEKIGKFPSLDESWNETDFKLQDVLVNLAKISLMPLFQIKVKQDAKDKEQNKLYLTDGRLGLGRRELYMEERDSDMLTFYSQWMVDTLVLLGADVTEVKDDVEKVIDFEIALAKLMRSDADKENFKSVYKTFDVDTLQVKFPWIQWLELIQGITTSAKGSIGVYVGKDEVVINQEPKYFEEMGVLLQKTPKRVLANYLMSHLLPLTEYLDKPFQTQIFKYNQKVLEKKMERRWEYCANLATSVFAETVSRLYVDKHFSKAAKEEVESIVSDVMDVFRQQIQDNAWMADKTKQTALAKLNNMVSRVAFPEYLYNKIRQEKLYSEISTNEGTFFKNMASVMAYRAVQSMKQLRLSPDSNTWVMQPTSLHGHYNQDRNEIFLPAAFLQAPIYSPEFTSAMNYAGVASIMSREMVHGFDKIGKMYSPDGKVKNWWTAKDDSGYDSRASCFLDQWGCYKWDGLSMSGKSTLHENIAYNAGLKHSYKAYRTMVARRGSEEELLPGLKFNNHQVFFISYAQMWCAKYGDEAKQEFLSSSIHPPFPYRVFGTLQNSMEFSKAFECAVGTRMNPMQKCTMW